jgi:hypothetical protein
VRAWIIFFHLLARRLVRAALIGLSREDIPVLDGRFTSLIGGCPPSQHRSAYSLMFLLVTVVSIWPIREPRAMRRVRDGDGKAYRRGSFTWTLAKRKHARSDRAVAAGCGAAVCSCWSGTLSALSEAPSVDSIRHLTRRSLRQPSTTSPPSGCRQQPGARCGRPASRHRAGRVDRLAQLRMKSAGGGSRLMTSRTWRRWRFRDDLRCRTRWLYWCSRADLRHR